MKVLKVRYMKSLDKKLIIYDSNCKVCSSLREVVLRLTPIPGEQVIAYRSLSPALSCRVDPGRFRNGMALVDTAGGKTIYGEEGVAYIFSSQYKLVDFLLNFKAVFVLFSFMYKTLAYNRYIIAAPKSRFLCDCFPDRVVQYRIWYIVISVIVSIMLTAMFGISLRAFFSNLTAPQAVLQMLLIAGTGWVGQLLLAAIFLRDKVLDYTGHLGSIMVAGLLILVPWMLFYAVTGVLNPYLPAVSVFISSACMLYLHFHRVRHLGLSQVWTMSWFLLLQSGAVDWIVFFHINQGL